MLPPASQLHNLAGNFLLPDHPTPEIDSLVTPSVLDDVALRDGRDSVGSIERDRPDSKNAGGAGIS